MKRVVTAVTFTLLVCLPFALTACGMKKNDASAEGGATAASASAVVDDTAASASVAASSNTPSAAVAVAPASVPGVVADPNARPSTESDDSTAKAEISKANYKKELDRLEKEDLSQDKK